MPIHEQFLVATQSFVLRRTPRLHLSPQEEFCGQFSAENTGMVTVKNATWLPLTQEQANPHFPFLWAVPWMPRAKDPHSLRVYIFLLPYDTYMNSAWCSVIHIIPENIKILVGLYVFISSLHEWCSPGQDLFHFSVIPPELNPESGTRLSSMYVCKGIEWNQQKVNSW